MTTLAFSPQLPLSRRVRLATTAAICLAVLLLAASAWLARENLHGVEAGNRLGDRVQAAQLASERLLSTLKDAETGQRGYLLTGDPKYLEPYDAAQARLDADFARLKQEPLRDPARSQHVAAIRMLAAAKLAELARTVALREAGQGEAALAVVRTDEGKRIMDAIHAEVNALQADAEAKLAQGRAQVGSAYAWSGTVGWAGLAALLLSWVALVQRRVRLAIAAGLIKLERFSRAFGLVQGMMRDRDGRITYWDGGAERLYGYSSEEALGRVSHELLRAEFPRPREEIDAELAREGRWRGELVHRCKDGTELAVASQWALHRGRPGEAPVVIEVSNDITALKRAEAALRRSEALLSAVLDALPVGVIIADPAGRIVRDNAANRALWGIPPEATNWQSYGAWVGWWPETGERIEAEEWAMTRALLQGEVVQGELVECARFGTGERRFFLNNAAPVHDEAGELVGGVVVELDVTERRAAETALRDSEERLRLAQEAGGVGVWHWVPATGEEHFSEAMHQLYGLLPGAMRSYAQWLAMVHPEDRDQMAAACDAAIAARRPFDLEFRVTRADTGTVRWINAKGRAEHGKDGEVTRVLGVNIDITERILATRKLAERERLLRLALDASELGTWRWDVGQGTDRLEWDARCKALFGLPPDAEVAYADWASALLIEDRARAEAAVARAVDPADPHDEFVCDYRVVHPDGTVLYLAATGRATFAPDPAAPAGRRVVSNQGTIRDVTAARQAAAALVEREAEAREAQRLARVGSWRWDAATDATTGSEELYRIYGVDPSGPFPNFAAQRGTLYAAEDWDRIDAAARHAAETGEGYTLDVRAFRQGERIWITARCEVLHDAAGRVVGLRGTVQDVTERRAAEEALAESEARFRALAEVVPSLLFETDAAGRNTYVNPRMAEYSGLSTAELLGDGWLRMLHPDDQARTAEAWAAAVAGGERYEIEYRFRAADGRYRWFLCRGVPARGADGTIQRWVGACMDIDDAKQAQDRLRLVVHELNHRVKNTLATVQSIAAQTLRGADPAIRRALEGRLAALAAAHDVLTREHWAGAELDSVVDGVLAPHGGRGSNHFQVSGPRVRLQPQAAVALALGLHELATNALKHGALKHGALSPGAGAGLIELRWSTANGRLRLVWSERGGPPVTPPSRRGFGTKLIERSLALDLRGTAEIAFAPEGVTCTVDAPLAEAAAPAEMMAFPRIGNAGGFED